MVIQCLLWGLVHCRAHQEQPRHHTRPHGLLPSAGASRVPRRQRPPARGQAGGQGGYLCGRWPAHHQSALQGAARCRGGGSAEHVSHQHGGWQNHTAEPAAAAAGDTQPRLQAAPTCTGVGWQRGLGVCCEMCVHKGACLLHEALSQHLLSCCAVLVVWQWLRCTCSTCTGQNTSCINGLRLLRASFMYTRSRWQMSTQMGCNHTTSSLAFVLESSWQHSMLIFCMQEVA